MARNQLPFFGLNVHYVNNNWEQRSFLLDFRELEGSHSGENMERVFVDVLDEFGITDKVSTVYHRTLIN